MALVNSPMPKQCSQIRLSVAVFRLGSPSPNIIATINNMIAATDTRPATRVKGPKPVRDNSTPRKLPPQIRPSVISITQFKAVPEDALFPVMVVKLAA